MSQSLARELEQLPADIASLLAEHRFNRERLLKLAERANADSPEPNRLSGKLSPPAAGQLQRLPSAGSEDYERLVESGRAALSRGECALILMAGGMATRMGGVVKSLVEVFPGKTFLDLRLAEIDSIRSKFGPAPLWLMTSHATDDPIREALGERSNNDDVATFRQELSLRLNPDGTLFRDASGRPSVHASGHGDLPDALKASGLLDRFVERGGRTVTIANIDNLGATLDPLLIGFHLQSENALTCELVENLGSDKGGIPVSVDGKAPIIVEDFRLPSDFDRKSVPVFNSNTFHVDARALSQTKVDWTFFRVQKQVDDKPAIQFERLIQELTAALDTNYVEVPRSGGASRFLPVKDFAELERRRDDIRAVATQRGMIQ